MATTLMESHGINVTRYAGVVREDSGRRQRYQITNEAMGEYVTLSWEQLGAIIGWITGTNARELLYGSGVDG